ncbi:MAG: hypothetical protein BWY09_01854 [Candidatus Hydrogenedentes bacterium ADurb.Bin179]|jgi:hypothetical protein|nr:MAG: hypothetical protein BWY09_01854 [Candidatus Hydrogenedentes bacterium ADurb.Bin179]
MSRLDSVKKYPHPVPKALARDSVSHPETAWERKGIRSGGDTSYKGPLPPFRVRQRPDTITTVPVLVASPCGQSVTSPERNGFAELRT